MNLNAPQAGNPESNSLSQNLKTGLKAQAALLATNRRQPPAPKRDHVLRPTVKRRRPGADENIPDSEKMPFRRPEWETTELLAWAFENSRADVLAEYGIYEGFEP